VVAGRLAADPGHRPDQPLIAAAAVSGTGGTGELVSAQSGDCLDTAGNGTPGPYVYSPGDSIQIYGCNGGINPEFSPTSTGELRTMGATECLDVYGSNTAPGTKVELWPCDGGANQKWTIESGHRHRWRLGYWRRDSARWPVPGRRSRLRRPDPDQARPHAPQ